MKTRKEEKREGKKKRRKKRRELERVEGRKETSTGHQKAAEPISDELKLTKIKLSKNKIYKTHLKYGMALYLPAK